MSDRHGTVRIEVVAEWYGCDVAWLVRVHARGLLPATALEQEPPRTIALEDLDRVADLVRWHLRFGVDLDLIEAMLRRA